MKQKDFCESFQNILLTLSYNQTMDESMKEKLLALGQKMCEDLPDVVPLVK